MPATSATAIPRIPLPSDDHLKISKHGDAMVVRFGKCHIADERAGNAFSLELHDVAERDDVRYLILDFSSIERLSSVMLRNVLTLRNEMASTGRTLVLCGLGPELRSLFSNTMLDQILAIKGSVVEALRLYA